MKAQMKGKSPEDMKAEMKKWEVWMEKHKDSIVDPGAPVGSAKRVSEGGKVEDIRNTIGGYMIIQAENVDAAAKIYDDSPHFGVEGGGVEIMEVVEM